jgi:hypothetical protein
MRALNSFIKHERLKSVLHVDQLADIFMKNCTHTIRLMYQPPPDSFILLLQTTDHTAYSVLRLVDDDGTDPNSGDATLRKTQTQGTRRMDDRLYDHHIFESTASG